MKVTFATDKCVQQLKKRVDRVQATINNESIGEGRKLTGIGHCMHQRWTNAPQAVLLEQHIGGVEVPVNDVALV